MSKIIPNDPSIVIAGSWNVAIMSPPWLQKHIPAIFKEGENIPIDVVFGGQPEIKINAANMIIHPTSTRLAISATVANRNTYDNMIIFSNEIMNALHHTPVTAIGHNIAYTLEDNETFQVLESQTNEGDQAFYDDKLEGGTLISQNIQHSIGFENKKLNLSYAINKEQRTISYNFHYDLLNVSISKKDIINEFIENIEYSESTLEKLVKK
jgi:hypothetical protein